jgi:RNA polymerase primary sigma factor
VARKHLRTGLSLMELVSDGNITLMRAVESFDIHRGYRFSTYATLALVKGFARSVPLMLAARAVQPTGDAMTELVDTRVAESSRLADRDHLRKLLAVLDPHERDVLLAHYGITEGGAVERRLNLSPRRLKQIEEQAIGKIRAALGESAA